MDEKCRRHFFAANNLKWGASCTPGRPCWIKSGNDLLVIHPGPDSISVTYTGR